MDHVRWVDVGGARHGDSPFVLADTLLAGGISNADQRWFKINGEQELPKGKISQ